MNIKTILHPTDFSSCAKRALEQAAELARMFEARLHLFHKVVYPLPVVPPEMVRQLEDSERVERLLKESLERPELEARRKLDSRVETLRGMGLEVTASLEKSGSPFEALLENVEKIRPDLIVMGTHGREGLEKVLVGSVTEKILRHGTTNVMTVAASASVADGRHGFGTVLVPVDFSDYSQRAVVAARWLVSRGGGSLCLLHVIEPVHSPFHPGKLVSPTKVDPALAGRYETALEGVLGDSPGEVLVVEGNVPAKILQLREKVGASLVVMGTRGLSGVKHLLMGSVTQKIIPFCEVPVMVVR